MYTVVAIGKEKPLRKLIERRIHCVSAQTRNQDLAKRGSLLELKSKIFA